MGLVLVAVYFLYTVEYHDHDDLVRHDACLVQKRFVTLLDTLRIMKNVIPLIVAFNMCFGSL